MVEQCGQALEKTCLHCFGLLLWRDVRKGFTRVFFFEIYYQRFVACLGPWSLVMMGICVVSKLDLRSDPLEVCMVYVLLVNSQQLWFGCANTNHIDLPMGSCSNSRNLHSCCWNISWAYVKVICLAAEGLDHFPI